MSNNTWDDYAEGWDSNSDVITYAERAFQSLTDAIDCKGARILDFGCGTGLLTEKLSAQASTIVALDPSAKMISVLNDKHLQNVITIQSELTQGLLDQNKHLQTRFDLIVASSALAFVPDYKKTLLLLKQLLTENGRLVQWDWLKKNADAGMGFTGEEIANAFREAGLADIQVSVPFSMRADGNSMEVVMGIATNTR
ncbi:Methyltransferase domain-containing protein [Microbulbifer donghaiensis]|uniref:Methyltransferase domain-containing protein n=1 Tax=Microbulbifer donghaiensis TaxID=494016 RepID=A0A1M4XEX2_9GAMM|nr:class I SAM-dependent methyltransferase [Microbulbifer donghaiensis]SHE91920.1 Methyltransferase domain-containing protein [Microbulbifer donghaiensis]